MSNEKHAFDHIFHTLSLALTVAGANASSHFTLEQDGLHMKSTFALFGIVALLLFLGLSDVGVAADVKPRRILLRSSWQTVNIGDIGHTPGMLRLLQEHLPDAEVTLWPSNIGDGVEDMLRRNFPKVRIVKGDIDRDGKPTTDELRAAFEQCDFFLHGSGPSLVAQRQLAAWRKQTGKPYGVCGVTLSALNADARELLNEARFIYLRDSISLKYVQGLQLACPVVALGPDAAFAVHLRNDDTATTFLRKHQLEDGKFICVIPRLRYTPYWKIHNRAMTDEDRRKDEVSQKLKESDHAKVREAMIAFVRKTGMKVLVCPEDKSHMAVGKEMLVDPLPEDVRKNVVWRENYWLTDEAVSVYAKSLALLSMDMHSPIMAVANGTPAIHCRFKEQTSKGQMWRDVGLGDWLFDLDEEQDGSRITKAVLAIAENPDAAKQQVKKAMDFVKARQREAMATLAKK